MRLLTVSTLLLLLACRAFGGAYSLTNGSFSGWEGDTKTTWRIEEGMFTAGNVENTQPRNEFLSTVKEYGDFDLSVKWRLWGTEGFVNGGVQFRTKRVPNHHEVSGYQADLGSGTDGSLYDESRRNKMLAQPSKEVLDKAKKPLGEWNTYRIRAEGPHIQIWLNGVQTVDYTEEDKTIPLTGIIAVQIHGNAKSQVWYKDLFIEELGKGAPVSTGPVQQRFADRLPAPAREPFKDGKFEIRPGEVIVFTGGTNMVLESHYGWLEAMLTAGAPAKSSVRFRNMAWDGDTVFEQWRDQNFGSWKDQFDAINATCVFLCFGQMEASEPGFIEAYEKLIKEMSAITPRVVIIGPLPRKTQPSPEEENVKALAAKYKLPFVSVAWPADKEASLNGLHFTATGWKDVAAEIAGKLGSKSDLKPDRLLALRGAIAAKNRLWHNCWKTMNWAFAYSDRTEQPFGKGIGSHPPMAKELEQYKELIRAADDKIHDVMAGGPIEVESREVPPKVAEDPQIAERNSPAAEKATFKVRDGFEVELFADEKDGVVKPLSMRWDERGRLWVACSPSYPQLIPGEPDSDYLLICEDTNGDGRADKFQKFARGLTMPMGIEFAPDGGVYVCESTQLVLLKDTDGDGWVDSRNVVLSGFGTGDSHQMINSLRWGPDGCLWFSQGLHIFSRIETPHGIVHFDRAGLWRFDPRTWKLQGFFGNAAAGANCWGVTFDDWGQVFHCAADNNPGFYTTPGLGTWPNPPSYYNIGSLAISPVKGMCMEFINSTHLPAELQGVLCKPVYFANQVLLYKLVEDGSGYKTDNLGPLVTSSSNAFRPLGVQTGPDGALYVCDWYNPVIGHYQASYRDPNRDRTHGRIWRVTAKDRVLATRPALEAMRPEERVEQLRSPERWVRDQARRLLSATPAKDIPGEYWQPAEDAKPEFLYEVLAARAGQGEVQKPLLHRCLAHQDARLRAFALRVWSQIAPRGFYDDSEDDKEYLWKLLTNGVNDPHPRVRLEAVIAAGYFKEPEAVELALGVLDHPRDRFIDYALANTIRALKPVWQPALAAGTMTFEGNAAHLAYLLQTDGNADTVGTLQKMIQSGKVPEESLDGLRSMLISIGGPEQLSAAIKAGPFTVEIARALLTAAGQRGVKPSGDLRAQFDEWTKGSDDDGKGNKTRFLTYYQLGAQWGFPDMAEKLHAMITDSGTLELVAADAVHAWAAVAGRNAIPGLETLTADKRPPVAAAAAAALIRLDPAKGAPAAAGILDGTPGADRSADLLEAALSVQDGPAQLAAALSGKPPQKDTALDLLKALATAGRHEPALAAVLRKAAGLPENASVVPAYSADFVNKLITQVKSTGDATRGKEVFMAAQSACIGCHTVGDTGGITGPNLTAVGRGMTPELVTESVLWPRRQIKEGFFLTTVTTRDGKVLSGYKVTEDNKSLVLRAPGAPAQESVAKDQIKDRNDAGTLMPEGLTSWMTEQQRLDLLRYLFELGK